MSEAFLRGYLTETPKASYLPDTKEDLETLLKTYLLEKALYELGYEINSRLDRIRIPALGILKLVEE